MARLRFSEATTEKREPDCSALPTDSSRSQPADSEKGRQAGLSRRGLLALGGGTAIAVVAGGGGSSAFAATQEANQDDDDTVEVVRCIESRVFSVDGAEEVKTRFPAELRLPQSAATSRTDIRIEYDERLFDAPEVGGVLVAGAIPLPVHIRADEAGVLTLSVPESARAVFIPARARNLYPAEFLSSTEPTTLQVGEKRLVLEGSRRAANPWGVELNILWAVADAVSYPAGIEVVSVGPAGTPPGLEVAVTLSSELTGDLSESGESLDLTEVSSKAQSLAIRIDDPIPAGESRSINIDSADEQWHMPGAKTITRVELIVSESAMTDARSTERTSVAAVDGSGGPLSDFTIQRKA